MNVETLELSAKTRRAIAKYGVPACLAAWHKNRLDGEGPATIAATTWGLTNVASANAAINAGTEIAMKDHERRTKKS